MRFRWKYIALLFICPLLYFIISSWTIGTSFQRSSTGPSPYPTSRNCVNHTHAPSLPSNIIRLPFDKGPSTSRTEVRLLILTYMRSGSTFLGSMFDRHPATMYVFEPLMTVDKTFTLRDHIGPLFWDKRSSVSKTELRERILSGFLNCNFKDVYPKALVNYFNSMGTKTNQFLQCHASRPGLLGILSCLPQLQRHCLEAKAVVIKTIRYPMQEAFNLMRADPKLRVIHLLRDPRSTLISQEWLGEFNKSTVIPFSRAFCETVRQDILAGDQASKRYSDRVIRVRYEDISRNPVPYIKHLLVFAGLSMLPEIESYIQEVTGGNRSDYWAKNVHEIVRKTNSTATAFAWRDRYDFYHTSRIDSQCGYLYKLAGYLPLDTEKDLRNRTVPSIVSVSKIPRFLRLT